jgi:hypothetical protein
MDRLEGSEIRRLLNFKGSSRLEVKDDLTERILSSKGFSFSGNIRFRFIESKKYIGEGGDWAEYKVLFSILKCRDTIEYLQYILTESSKLIGSLLDGIEIDYIRLEEFDCSRADYYYILLDIRRDGKEIEENEINKIFKDLLYEECT